MERWKESQLNQISGTTEIDTAYRISVNFAKNIGFEFFAFSISYQQKNDQPNVLKFNNYPADWNTEYEQKNFRAIDPIVAHCNQSMMPILWSEALFSKTPLLWDAIEYQGMQHGWSQSVHDEDSGFCSILSLARSNCPITALELYENLGFSILIGRHLHALVAQSLPKRAAPPVPRLSEREIDVLKLAADGKTADQSAKILHITARTVGFHMQRAIQKFGVNNKTSAVIAAKNFGYLIH